MEVDTKVGASGLTLYRCLQKISQSNVNKKKNPNQLINREKHKLVNIKKSMSIRLALTSFNCLMLVGCNPNMPNIKTSDFTEIKPTENVQLLANKISINQESTQISNYMTLSESGMTNNLGNPLFELRLYANGKLINSFMAVSGRNYTQNRNRHVSGTEAPLPNGIYKVARTHTRGTITEAGERFLPITPQFSTGRTALGIHVDPSFNKNNGEDGTSGCIGMISREDLDTLLNYVNRYQPKYLDVQI
ncbi:MULTISPECIES: L,D-transpeptidase [unclassified Calothrix]|uniref:L,D-transpeptidase n=1 Tax=unclassified Calothrix TaxID=2619626 RepID=UPI0028C43B69|nr:L,D-transpeptidase [Calothrix sp. FACHB-168]